MDEISQEPRRDFKLPPGPRRWLTVVAVIGLVAAITVAGVSRLSGHRGAGAGASGRPSTAASRDSQSVIAASAAVAPGTVLLTCDSVVWSHPDRNWQAGSLRVGTLWLLDGRQQGYARLGRSRQAPSVPGTPSLYVRMLVHVDAGSTVVMRAATGTGPYFEFLNSPNTADDYQGFDWGTGYTFVPCPTAGARYDGVTDFYEVGFSIVPGHTAAVQILTSPSARPVWLTFSAPAGQG